MNIAVPPAGIEKKKIEESFVEASQFIASNYVYLLPWKVIGWREKKNVKGESHFGVVNFVISWR